VPKHVLELAARDGPAFEELLEVQLPVAERRIVERRLARAGGEREGEEKDGGAKDAVSS
jgi:hypothetical protein